MDKTCVERIVHDVCGALRKHIPRLAGCIDDQPTHVEEYEYPPLPPDGAWGESALPFAFVYEVDEVPSLGGTNAWNQTINGQIQLVFRYGQEGAERLARTGRDFRGDIKRALMLDPTRGGHAFRTYFGRNFTDQLPVEGLAVAVVDFEVKYFHNLTDPTTRDIATSN